MTTLLTHTTPLTRPRPPTLPTPVTLLGIGTASPPALSQADTIALSEEFSCSTDSQRAWLRRIFSRCGIDSRGCVLQKARGPDDVRAFYGPPTPASPLGPTTAARMRHYAAEAPVLATRAAQAALADAHLEPAAITHLLTVSCTGFYAPGLDSDLILRLNLRPDTHRLHIGFMGCHGAFNALAAARDILHANPAARILVCSVELCTLHFAYGFNPEKMVANSLFADAASACIVGTPEESLSEGPIAPAPRFTLRRTASLLLPDSRTAMTWQIGDHGFEMTLSSQLPTLIQTHLAPWIDSLLADSGLTRADIRHWPIHPGGPKILAAAANALALPESALAPSRHILKNHGNMSSATLLFLLHHLTTQIPTTPGPALALGFGPGLIAEALLLDLA